MEKAELVAKIREALSDRIIQVVAERSGVGTNTIHDLVSGRTNKRGPHVSTLRILADYLGVKSGS